jgi:hypothetical protein
MVKPVEDNAVIVVPAGIWMMSPHIAAAQAEFQEATLVTVCTVPGEGVAANAV